VGKVGQGDRGKAKKEFGSSGLMQQGGIEAGLSRQ
jgi:hypothetical protein